VILMDDAKKSGGSRIGRLLVRLFGLGPVFMPRYRKRQLRAAGYSRSDLQALLGNVRTIDQLSEAWEREAVRCHGAQDWDRAYAAFCRAHRHAEFGSPRREQLFAFVVESYRGMEHPVPLTELHVPCRGGGTIGALLQIPDSGALTNANGQVPMVIMVPGLRATKERFHSQARQFLEAGCAVLRLDMPGNGGTTALNRHVTEHPAVVAQWVCQNYPAVDPARLHMFGFCFGGSAALASAAIIPCASVTAVSPVYDPISRLHRYPKGYTTTLEQRVGASNTEEFVEILRTIAVDSSMAGIDAPAFLYYAAFDRISPLGDMLEIKKNVSAETEMRIFPFEAHACRNKLDLIVSETIERLDVLPARLAAPHSAAA